jgi:uncharacterized protein (DUF736 family)
LLIDNHYIRHTCVQVLRRFDLKDKVEMGWGERYRVGTNLKWTPDQVETQALPPAEQLRARMDAEIAASFPHNRKVPARVDGQSRKKVSVKAKKTADFEEGVRARRFARIDAAWRERLRGASQYLPYELEKPELERQRRAAEAQAAELPFEALVERARLHVHGQAIS